MSNSKIPKFQNSQTLRHIAIIMDGNGRWAQARGLPRSAGHKHGAEAARRAVTAARELGVEYITLFGFSSENWNRPPEEIKQIMHLLRFYLRSETAELHRNNAKLKVIGDRSYFEKELIKLIENAEKLTQNNTGIHVTIALNYGGRNDILQAAAKLALQAEQDGKKANFDYMEEHFDAALMSAHMPDPDIVIRTSGEQRISNFLLWQSAYSEFIFMDVLWPDFAKQHLESALEEYKNRDRRFGGVQTTTIR